MPSAPTTSRDAPARRGDRSSTASGRATARCRPWRATATPRPRLRPRLPSQQLLDDLVHRKVSLAEQADVGDPRSCRGHQVANATRSRSIRTALPKPTSRNRSVFCRREGSAPNLGPRPGECWASTRRTTPGSASRGRSLQPGQRRDLVMRARRLCFGRLRHRSGEHRLRACADRASRCALPSRSPRPTGCYPASSNARCGSTMRARSCDGAGGSPPLKRFSSSSTLMSTTPTRDLRAVRPRSQPRLPTFDRRELPRGVVPA